MEWEGEQNFFTPSYSYGIQVHWKSSCGIMQVLRRHGDVFELTSRGYYHAHGRADDTMNLGGIKVHVLLLKTEVYISHMLEYRASPPMCVIHYI